MMNKTKFTAPPCCECQKNDEGKDTKKSTHTKIASVRAHLESGRSITPLEALRLYGSFRLSAIIFVLRERGLDIKTDMVENRATRSRYARYYLYQE